MSIQASRTVAGVILLGVLIAIFWYMKKDTSYVAVTTFEECVQAGYETTGTSTVECRTPDNRVFIQETSTSSATTTATATNATSSNKDLIRAINVSPNQKITSPLIVKGEARGSWYFEASFPVNLLDGNGNPIAQMPAQALGDWMTSEFVPFEVTLSFAKPATATGTLILHNDNPSGLPERDRFISIPVRF